MHKLSKSNNNKNISGKKVKFARAMSNVPIEKINDTTTNQNFQKERNYGKSQKDIWNDDASNETSTNVGNNGEGGGGRALAHVTKPYARDFLVHIHALNTILLKNYINA